MSEEISVEMPKYRSHKEVWALKIKKIEYLDDARAALTFENEDYAPIEVSSSWTGKHDPKVGGYYVVYADGYKSFSPAKAFEEGYTQV